MERLELYVTEVNYIYLCISEWRYLLHGTGEDVDTSIKSHVYIGKQGRVDLLLLHYYRRFGKLCDNEEREREREMFLKGY